MTSVELHEYFDLLLDKQGSPYFTDDNKDMFLNMAQLEYVKRLLPSNEGGIVNAEETQLVFNNIYTLVYEVSCGTMNGSGLIPVTTAQTALNAASSGTDPLMYVLNVSLGGLPVLYTRHNDWYEFERNAFKQGTAENPRYRYNNVNFVFSPVNTTDLVSMSLLKTPRNVVLNSVDSELPAHTHKSLVELAVELASVAIREGDLAQLNSLQK